MVYPFSEDWVTPLRKQPPGTLDRNHSGRSGN
jgi:hypothetical protein